jgi:nitrogen fixation/metabolism regulation signal transduction histidine kinase
LSWSHASLSTWIFSLLGVLSAWAILQAWVVEQLLRPMQTLANVVAALREEDYSFRARGARRGDSLGDLALEINALASDLQAERLTSLESAALVRRVLEAIDAPVLAFDEKGKLRLVNPAAVRLLHVNAKTALGRPAAALDLEHLLTLADEQVTTLGPENNSVQWMVRRSAFRQHGVPHTLVLLSDVSVALRQEERQAWQRLIRVLGHEINNSLTPIKSIAGSLRHMVHSGASSEEFARPLEVIEQRAESLNHFLSAYRRLAQLPPPRRAPFSLTVFLEQLALLETRLPVRIEPGPDILINADKDQLGQAVINLLRNAAEASLDNPKRPAQLALSWAREGNGAHADVVVRIRDSGLGVANPANLFVPFYTTKQSGTGIGLALVKTIVEAHQGTITLVDHPEGGAQAELRLPL